MTSLLELQEAWQKHPKFKNRALGGRRALDGFHYQLAVSLDHFFEAVLKADGQAANLAFEGLSDLSELRGDITYLVQIKTTLTKEFLSSALAEALAIDEFLEKCFKNLRESVRFALLLGASAVISQQSLVFSPQLICSSIRSQRDDGILLEIDAYRST